MIQLLYEINTIARSLANDPTSAEIRATLKAAGVDPAGLARLRKPELLSFAVKCAELLDIYNSREIRRIPSGKPKYEIGGAKWIAGEMRGTPSIRGFKDRSPSLATIDDHLRG